MPSTNVVVQEKINQFVEEMEELISTHVKPNVRILESYTTPDVESSTLIIVVTYVETLPLNSFVVKTGRPIETNV